MNLAPTTVRKSIKDIVSFLIIKLLFLFLEAFSIQIQLAISSQFRYDLVVGFVAS